MDGKPLSRPHGSPARVVIPEMYGYKGVKWLTRIELVDAAADRLLGRPRLRPERLGRDGRMAMAEPAAAPALHADRARRALGARDRVLVLLGSGLCLYLPSLAEAVEPAAAPEGRSTSTRPSPGRWRSLLVVSSATAARCVARCARSTASTPTTVRGCAAARAAGPAERGPEAEHGRHRRVRVLFAVTGLLPLVRRARHALPLRRARCSCTTG